MAGLIKQVEKRHLPKAGDADRDPADLGNSQSTDESASRSTASPGIESASVSASENNVRNAGVADSTTTARSTGGNTGTKAARKTSAKKRPTTSRKPRRTGRPKGPDRTPVTVRILSELDDALTTAVEDTGRSPQYIIDDALRAWLTDHRYLDPTR